MSNDDIELSYNEDLESLESILAKVNRPGSFYCHGTKEIPMPTLKVKGAGIVSFPIPKTQAKKLIQEATQAPYGKGTQTILDRSVRKVWQLSPSQIHLGGAHWEKHLDEIVKEVKNGLGCQKTKVTAELYKMLVYQKGDFFLPHRDSEKTPGMFGTLVIALPSAHVGGELFQVRKLMSAG